MHLASELQDIESQVRPSPWAGHEHYRGYAVMVLPFSSGHLLGLRAFPENDVAPYTSVWHRTPEGDWSIYSDGPSLKTTRPTLVIGQVHAGIKDRDEYERTRQRVRAGTLETNL